MPPSEYRLRISPELFQPIKNLMQVGSEEKNSLHIKGPSLRILARMEVAEKRGINRQGRYEIYMLKSDADFLDDMMKVMNVEDVRTIEVKQMEF